jgi:predicted nucleotidyltransferase
MQLTEAERDVLEKLAETLRREFGASRILLHGSAARGQLEEGSDIDLLVVLPKVDWEIEKDVVSRCFQAELTCGRVISAACFTANEITETPLRVSPFVLNAQREGVEL